MTSTDDCPRVIEETIKELGGIDIVISNMVCLISFAFPRLPDPEFIRRTSGASLITCIHLSPQGWTRFSEFADLDAMSYDEWDKCWAANVKVPHALLKAAKPTFENNRDGGVLITTGSIAVCFLSIRCHLSHNVLDV